MRRKESYISLLVVIALAISATSCVRDEGRSKLEETPLGTKVMVRVSGNVRDSPGAVLSEVSTRSDIGALAIKVAAGHREPTYVVVSKEGQGAEAFTYIISLKGEGGEELPFRISDGDMISIPYE